MKANDWEGMIVVYKGSQEYIACLQISVVQAVFSRNQTTQIGVHGASEKRTKWRIRSRQGLIAWLISSI
jgi:hypothetical protein